MKKQIAKLNVWMPDAPLRYMLKMGYCIFYFHKKALLGKFKKVELVINRRGR